MRGQATFGPAVAAAGGLAIVGIVTGLPVVPCVVGALVLAVFLVWCERTGMERR